jgi:hypothetical protein
MDAEKLTGVVVANRGRNLLSPKFHAPVYPSEYCQFKKNMTHSTSGFKKHYIRISIEFSAAIAGRRNLNTKGTKEA